MPQMIPSIISDDIKSTGEKKIFKRFKGSKDSQDWLVLHSLYLSRHVKRLFGEIDFLVLAPNLGIFVLEVKSGRVSRKDGIWYFTDRYGKSGHSHIGPFNQASDAMFTLKSEVTKHYGKEHHLSRLLFGYGVIFPNMDQRLDKSIEYDDWQIQYSFSGDIDNYISKLSKNYSQKYRNNAWFDSVKSLPTLDDVNQLMKLFRGDFDRPPHIRNQVQNIEEKIFTYTQEQFKILDRLKRNTQFICIGGAGTGKTMIAIEQAKRMSTNNYVGLICHNKLLAAWLKKVFNNNDNVYVNTIHGMMTQELKIKIKNPKFFQDGLPQLFLEKLDLDKFKIFDFLIIDEGQDLFYSENYLEVFDCVLIGGLSNGSWSIYADPENQTVFNEIDLDLDQIDLMLLKYSEKYAHFALDTNCRNTHEIKNALFEMTGCKIPNSIFSQPTSIPVDYRFYSGENEHIKKIDRIIAKLKKDKISLNDITILSSKIFSRSICNQSKYNNLLSDLNSLSVIDWESIDKITFSTIRAFKGLENQYIIISEIGDISDSNIIKLLYVAISRARIGLYILLDEKYKNIYNNLVKESLLN